MSAFSPYIRPIPSATKTRCPQTRNTTQIPSNLEVQLEDANMKQAITGRIPNSQQTTSTKQEHSLLNQQWRKNLDSNLISLSRIVNPILLATETQQSHSLNAVVPMKEPSLNHQNEHLADKRFNEPPRMLISRQNFINQQPKNAWDLCTMVQMYSAAVCTLGLQPEGKRNPDKASQFLIENLLKEDEGEKKVGCHGEEDALRLVMSDVEKYQGGHRCIYCGKIYSRKYGLKIHIRTHTGYKPLKCKFCQRPFGDPSNLNKHVRIHTPALSPYRCRECGVMTLRKRDLERHMSCHHNTDQQVETSKLRASAEEATKEK